MATMSRDIPIALIDADPDQPRRHFDQLALQELADSLASDGQVVPITVRPVEDRFVIVQGERRWRAAQLAGLHSLRAEVSDIAPDAAYLLALIENVQRADLTPLEEATAYDRLLGAGYNQTTLAKRIGKTQSYIAQKMRLLRLPECLKVYLSAGALSEGHMRQLLRLRGLYGEDVTEALLPPSEESIRRLADLLADRQITVLAFMLQCRPLDQPVAGIDPIDDELDMHFEAVETFFREVGQHAGKSPVWVRIALFYAMVAVHFSVSVADLVKTLDSFENLILGVVYANSLYKQPPAPNAPDKDRILYFAIRSDLRHAGLSSIPTQLLERSLKHVAANGTYVFPSQLQPGGPHEGDVHKHYVA